MKTLRARNVNGLYQEGLELLSRFGTPAKSRGGDVIVAPWPVVSVYEQPCERVLFDATRDANPFFHLMEGLWMLAGRNDSAFLDRYVRDFGARYGEEDDGRMHGAYGHRWRHALGYDQLDEIVRRLQANPGDRQCVLQMWDATVLHVVTQDALGVGERIGEIVAGSSDLLGGWKDRPCNTHCYFRVRETEVEEKYASASMTPEHMLDMTICCRSNDIVWGAYGANAVHMSMMMEYVAGRIGVGVGTMYQLSNNYHGYVEVLDGLGDPTQIPESDYYDDGTIFSIPMGENWSAWDADLGHFMAWHDWLGEQTSEYTDISVGVHNTTQNSWFMNVAVPIAQARWHWTRGEKKLALESVDKIQAPDWHHACRAWMTRRTER